MSGTQVQNVSSVAVDIALSMSAWLTVAAAGVPPSLPSPPHAASAALTGTAPAEASKVRRLTGNCGDDVAMVNSRQKGRGDRRAGQRRAEDRGYRERCASARVLPPLVSDADQGWVDGTSPPAWACGIARRPRPGIGRSGGAVEARTMSSTGWSAASG